MKEKLISSKYEGSSKSIGTESVFTKTEVKNELNVIFLKIRGELKKYRDWSCTYQDRNEESKYEVSSKSIETEAVFTKTEVKN